MNAETVGHAGTATLKLLNTENIDMFRHPKYYKELKEFGKRGDRGKPTAASPDTDQAISFRAETSGTSVRPGPGLKHQAASVKRQAPKPEPSSGSAILSHKLQASSYKRQA